MKSININQKDIFNVRNTVPSEWEKDCVNGANHVHAFLKNRHFGQTQIHISPVNPPASVGNVASERFVFPNYLRPTTDCHRSTVPYHFYFRVRYYLGQNNAEIEIYRNFIQ